jgi:hypothetical protein
MASNAIPSLERAKVEWFLITLLGEPDHDKT